MLCSQQTANILSEKNEDFATGVLWQHKENPDFLYQISKEHVM